MNRTDFDNIVSTRLKLIRTEYNYTQDTMAEIIGISKKTLVQVEKERQTLGWNNAVCIATIFKDSEVLKMTFGDDVIEIVPTLAFTNYEVKKSRSLSMKFWWSDVKEKNGFKIQKNYITHHYRILDKDNVRITSSFGYNYIEGRFNELTSV